LPTASARSELETQMGEAGSATADPKQKSDLWEWWYGPLPQATLHFDAGEVVQEDAFPLGANG